MATLLAKITNSISEYSENLLTPFCTFDKTHTWNIISGGANGIVSNSSVRKFEGSKSLRVDFTGVGQLVFSSGSTEMNFTAPKDGIYILSSRFFRELTATGDVSFEFTLFKNAIPFLEINENFNTETFELGKWNNFAQSFELEEGDVLSFVLKIGSSITGNHIYIDGLKLELDDRNLGIPSVYSRPIEQKTGWQSKVDTINTQVLTANTDNLIAFTGTNSSNGGLTLMNSVGKITPIKISDALSVDFVFTFPSPSGTTDYLSVKLKVNGIVYRAQSFNILEPTGETNYVAVSFNLPVEADFETYGAEFFVNPNVAITISNRYLQVTRTHKGI